tara:strand:+ start:404 stop:820 length:417 start_codon:yes stop_codon:yes gene_type:complete
MPRITTAKSLMTITSKKHTEETLTIARTILLKIHDGEIPMERQEVYDNMIDLEDTLVEEFYGEFNGLGITARKEVKTSKKSGRMHLVIESDHQTIEIPGPAGAKAWVLCNNAEKKSEEKIEDLVQPETLDNLKDLLGL